LHCLAPRSKRRRKRVRNLHVCGGGGACRCEVCVVACVYMCVRVCARESFASLLSRLWPLQGDAIGRLPRALCLIPAHWMGAIFRPVIGGASRQGSSWHGAGVRGANRRLTLKPHSSVAQITDMVLTLPRSPTCHLIGLTTTV